MSWLTDILTRFTEAFKWWFVLQPWEQALRVRAGRKIKKFEGGIHIKIPYIDAIFKQNCRLRITDCGHQTLTTADNHTITLTSQLRYRVEDVTPLYEKLHMAEETIAQMVQEAISDFVTASLLMDCLPPQIIEVVHERLDFTEFGLAEPKFAICDFACVKTYRIINEGFAGYLSHSLQTDKPEGQDSWI